MSEKSPMNMGPRDHRREALRLLIAGTKLHEASKTLVWGTDEAAGAQAHVANTIALGQLHATLSQDWDAR